ncbi:MAG: PQQ-binding-like beta-propeller repeat protein [Isosphaeraceae bacterium]
MAYIPIGPGESVMTLSVDEDLLFAQTDQANLYALDSESGQVLWTANLGRPTRQAQPVSVNSRSVFATNANTLYMIDRPTGRIVTAFQLEDFATSPTAANEDFVVVGTNSGRVVAFHVRDRSGENPPGPRMGFAFAWKSAATVTSRPIVTEKMLAFGSQDRRLFVATNEPHQILYRYVTGGPITAPIAPYGTRTVLVPSTDNILYAVDLFDPEDPQQIQWQVATGSPLTQEPLVAGEDIYTINSRGAIFSIEPKTGATKWVRATQGGRLLALGTNRLYLQTIDGDLFLIDRATGDILASPVATRERAGLCLRRYDLHVTNQVNDRIFLGNRRGELIGLREVGSFQPRPLRTSTEEWGAIPKGVRMPTMPGGDQPEDAAMENNP